MSIATQIERLTTARDRISTTLADKGVEVPDDALLADMPELVGKLPGLNQVVRTDIEQSLTIEEQARARANIGIAASTVVVEELTGDSVTIEIAGGRAYECGELTSLTITSVASSAEVSVVRFRSGAVPTTLSLPAALPVVGWRIPTANKLYDIYFRSGAATIVYYE